MTEKLSIRELARFCAAETARYARGLTYAERYCFELFRRAIVQRDETAWECILTQYASQVRHWVTGQAEDQEERVLTAFERFWQAVDEAKFSRFSSLAGILQYLKLCAHTTSVDRARATRAVGEQVPLESVEAVTQDSDNLEENVVARLDAATFWRTIRETVADEQEYLVLYFSYVIGLAPREIFARYGARFSSVLEIYRLKRNALDRLGRLPKDRMLR